MEIYSNYSKSGTNFSIYYHLHNIVKKIEFGLFLLLCIILIITSKVNHKITDNISLFMINLSLPIVKTVSYPFNTAIDLTVNLKELINARRDNKKLIAENEKLRSFYIKAINITQENKDLRDIVNFIGLRSTRYKTAYVIGKSHQLYNRSLFIGAGKDNDIEIDDVVLGKNSVIGRITEVAKDKSRILLLWDINSRIPIITSRSRTRGILAGDNTNIMKILYLNKKHNIAVGDMVFTSGDGESMQPGLLAGIVTKVNKQQVEVRTIEDIDNVNIVTIVKY